ncbi:MAG: hypothetical protein SP1CHLAM54_10920 [Chlamydiia bacterium]|nr:hypothetical protein [Chlamydiia bacterium]MCH9615997.1 hypothetical protein [Chlamydiia bacterium]MCH9629020.1 hypothetical protein [Chlamydiia bacterium]
MKECSIKLHDITLKAIQCGPKKAKGYILSSHGITPKEKEFAECLHKEGYSTLLFSILTEEEREIRDLRKNIPFQTKRLLEIRESLNLHCPVTYVGCAAELDAAAKAPELVNALVIPRGCPDHAHHLDKVQTPTLFLVEKDEAYKCLKCEKKHVEIEQTPNALAKETIGWIAALG